MTLMLKRNQSGGDCPTLRSQATAEAAPTSRPIIIGTPPAPAGTTQGARRPLDALIVGLWWLLREIELATHRVSTHYLPLRGAS